MSKRSLYCPNEIGSNMSSPPAMYLGLSCNKENILVSNHIGFKSYRFQIISVSNHIGFKSYRFQIISVSNHIGFKSYRFQIILVSNHITSISNISDQWHISLYEKQIVFLINHYICKLSIHFKQYIHTPIFNTIWI